AAPNDWLGNAVPPGSACVAALAARSRPRSRLGRDHSNRRSKPGRDSPRKETASPTARHGVRTRKRQVDGRHDCQDNAPACVPSTVWGTASRRNSQVGLGAVLALENEQALSRHPPCVSPSQPQRARPPANGTHSSTKSSRKPPLRQPRSVGRCPSLKASSPSKRGFSPRPTIAALSCFDAPIVVYSPYEQTTLRELAETFPDLRNPLTAIIGRLVDLLPIMRSAIYFPNAGFSNSIKSVGPALCPDFTYEDLEDIAD